MSAWLKRTLFPLCFLLAFSLSAQVVFTSEDLPQVGDTFPFAIDDQLLLFDIGMPGSNQTWDFSALKPSSLFLNSYVSPDSTPFASDFPDADLALVVGLEEPSYTYYKTEGNNFIIEGITLDLEEFGGRQLITFADPQLFTAIPTQLGTTYEDTAQFELAFEEPLTRSDLVYKSFQTTKVVTDAEGELLLPGGSYPALRQMIVVERVDSLFVVLFEEENFFDKIESTDTLYSWLSPDTKGIILNIDPGSGNWIYYAPELLDFQAPNAGFVYTTADNQSIAFQDSSSFATGWLWDFGDGNTSQEQNPIHQYDSNGTYQVCLEVTNFLGKDTTCQELNLLVSSINEFEALRNLIKLYPNPAIDQIRIQAEGIEKMNGQLYIFNAYGQLIKQSTFLQHADIDLQNWDSGAYSYLLITDQGFRSSGRFIIIQ